MSRRLPGSNASIELSGEKVTARAIVPALSPGALLEPSGALGRLSYFPVSTVLVSGAWLAVGTASTYLFSTELFLPCEDRSLDSCVEAVLSRGFPYPFVQRRFLPFAFLYDMLVLSALHLPLALLLRLRRRAVQHGVEPNVE